MLDKPIDYAPGVSESVILSRVQEFVEHDDTYRERAVAANADDRLFEKAALDSRYVLAMINFVEQEFGVFVSSCEISEENLGSLRAVARFVASKQPFAVG